jgi:hypothetical protein
MFCSKTIYLTCYNILLQVLIIFERGATSLNARQLIKLNELIIYCLLFAAPYPDSQRAVCSAAGGSVPRPCLRPLASLSSTRYSAEPEFFNF